MLQEAQKELRGHKRQGELLKQRAEKPSKVSKTQSGYCGFLGEQRQGTGVKFAGKRAFPSILRIIRGLQQGELR